MTISEILQVRVPIQIDLLTEFPLDNDPSTWKKIFEQTGGFPRITLVSGSAIAGNIDAILTIDPLKYAQVQAVGLSYQGQVVFVGYFLPGTTTPPPVATVRIEFFVQPWNGT